MLRTIQNKTKQVGQDTLKVVGATTIGWAVSSAVRFFRQPTSGRQPLPSISSVSRNTPPG